jgi:hypothetical protein
MRDKVDGIVEGLAIRTYGQDLQQQEQQQGEQQQEEAKP